MDFLVDEVFVLFSILVFLRPLWSHKKAVAMQIWLKVQFHLRQVWRVWVGVPAINMGENCAATIKRWTSASYKGLSDSWSSVRLPLDKCTAIVLQLGKSKTAGVLKLLQRDQSTSLLTIAIQPNKVKSGSSLQKCGSLFVWSSQTTPCVRLISFNMQLMVTPSSQSPWTVVPPLELWV